MEDFVQTLPTWVSRLMLGFHVLGLVAHSIGIALVWADGRMGLRLATFYTIGVGTEPDDRTSTVSAWVYPTQATFAFFWLSWGFHLAVIVALLVAERTRRGGGVPLYDWCIHWCLAPWRWLEYGFSAPLMLLVACLVLGARETHVIWCVVGSMAVCISFGWMTELHSSYLIERYDEEKGYLFCGHTLTRRWRRGTWKTRLQLHVLGYLPFAIAWGTIYDSYSQNVDRVRELVPDFVDYAVHSSFAAFALFGLVQLFNQCFPWGPSVYWACEAAYVVLSFAAKANLGFVTLYEALARGALFDQVMGAEGT